MRARADLEAPKESLRASSEGYTEFYTSEISLPMKTIYNRQKISIIFSSMIPIERMICFRTPSRVKSGYAPKKRQGGGYEQKNERVEPNQTPKSERGVWGCHEEAKRNPANKGNA